MQSLEDMLFLEIPLHNTEKTFLFLLLYYMVCYLVILSNMNKALQIKNAILHHLALVL